MSTILMTGAAGLTGFDFVRHWRAVHLYDRVDALDALTCTGVRRSLDGTAVDIEEIAGTVAWDAANEAWWRPLLGRSPVAEGAGASWGVV